MKTLVLFIAVVSAALHFVKGDTCYFNIHSHLPEGYEPLVLEHSNGKPTGIAYPNEVKGGQGLVAVTPQKELMLACTGEGNVLRYFQKSQTAVVRCKRGKRLVIVSGGVEKDVTKARTSCKKRSHSTVKRSGIPCGNGGEDLNVVFEVGKYKIPHISMCYNPNKRITLYSSHVIIGSALEGKVAPKGQPSFTNLVEWGPPNIVQLYNPQNQETVIQSILRRKNTKYYIDGRLKILERGHLAPNADFIYAPQRVATYYYENSAPQWGKFNAKGGNWIAIENAVRKLANEKIKGNLEVWTGTFGVLELPDTKNSLKEIYLYIGKDGKKLPVPKVFWKLVRDPNQDTCTVIIGHNNLYLTQEPSPLCTPITPTPKGWPTLTDLSKGFTYYCDYNSFIRAVTSAPSNIVCKGLLSK